MARGLLFGRSLQPIPTATSASAETQKHPRELGDTAWYMQATLNGDVHERS